MDYLSKPFILDFQNLMPKVLQKHVGEKETLFKQQHLQILLFTFPLMSIMHDQALCVYKPTLICAFTSPLKKKKNTVKCHFYSLLHTFSISPTVYHT